MLDRRSSLFFIILLLILIGFDAFQQKYYLDTFDLSNEPVSLESLLISHMIRWLTWVVVTTPIVFWMWKRFSIDNYVELYKLAGVALVSVVLSVALISAISIFRQDLVFADYWTEFFEFFFYQKGLVYLMAFSVTVFWIKNQAQSIKIDAQWHEISDLKKTSDQLNEALHDKDPVPHLNIKTKNIIKPIPIENIIWIQADDYCVKVHAKNQSFYLRKSMKFLEKELGHLGFIRVHRGALLNINFLDHVNFEEATVKLKDQSELPISKTGGVLLKRRIEERTI